MPEKTPVPKAPEAQGPKRRKPRLKAPKAAEYARATNKAHDERFSVKNLKKIVNCEITYDLESLRCIRPWLLPEVIKASPELRELVAQWNTGTWTPPETHGFVLEPQNFSGHVTANTWIKHHGWTSNNISELARGRCPGIRQIYDSSGVAFGYAVPWVENWTDTEITVDIVPEAGWELILPCTALLGCTRKELEPFTEKIGKWAVVNFAPALAYAIKEGKVQRRIQDLTGLELDELKTVLDEAPAEYDLRLIYESINSGGNVLAMALRLGLRAGDAALATQHLLITLARADIKLPGIGARANDPLRHARQTVQIPEFCGIENAVTVDEWGKLNNIKRDNTRAFAAKGRIAPMRLVNDEKGQLISMLVNPDSVIVPPGHPGDIEEIAYVTMSTWLRMTGASYGTVKNDQALLALRNLGMVRVGSRHYVPSNLTVEDMKNEIDQLPPPQKMPTRQQAMVQLIMQDSAILKELQLNARNTIMMQMRAEGKTLEEIATHVGMTRERVRQVENQVTRRGNYVAHRFNRNLQNEANKILEDMQAQGFKAQRRRNQREQ